MSCFTLYHNVQSPKSHWKVKKWYGVPGFPFPLLISLALQPSRAPVLHSKRQPVSKGGISTHRMAIEMAALPKKAKGALSSRGSYYEHGGILLLFV